MIAAAPTSCPRCRTPKARKRLGAEWCCWELAQLEALILRDAFMREVAHILVGRSEKSIDAACRRNGMKVPRRARSARRRRCAGCGELHLAAGGICAVCLNAPVARAA